MSLEDKTNEVSAPGCLLGIVGAVVVPVLAVNFPDQVPLAKELLDYGLAGLGFLIGAGFGLGYAIGYAFTSKKKY